MARFSNGGVDTFDEGKQFIGVRLQCGVPLLDRDWNEAEDVRRYFERKLRQNYIGDGTPDANSFKVVPAPAGVQNDFVISAGRCMVDGYDVWNPAPVLFSQVPGNAKLAANQASETLIVYVRPLISRVTSLEDRDLGNEQDINLETCVRDRLSWTVSFVRPPQQPPAGSFRLAQINRPANAARIEAPMIQDLRGNALNLRALVNENQQLRQQVVTLENRVNSLEVEMAKVKTQLARLFWDVSVVAGDTSALFGDTVQIRVKVINLLGEPIVNAFITCTTDWGTLDPGTAVTDNNGVATVELIGVEASTPPSRSDVGVLKKATEKVKRAMLPNPGAIQYQMVFLEPEEMSMVSQYVPQQSLVGIGAYVPQFPIVAQPQFRTATVTINAKESRGGVVRGIGTEQVRFGMWVRDWTRTKIYEVISRQDVGARVGAMIARGVKADRFDSDEVQGNLIHLYDQVQNDTNQLIKTFVFSNTTLDDNAMARSGVIGQTIANEAGASLGDQVNTAIEKQIQQVQQDTTVSPAARESARTSRTKVTQASTQMAAGMAQKQRQTLNSFKK
jgi:hypothetical protein